MQPNPLVKAITAKHALPAAKQKAQAGKHEKPVEDEDDDGDDSDEDDSEEDASDEVFPHLFAYIFCYYRPIFL